MKYCHNCRQPLAAAAAFCKNCGTQIMSVASPNAKAQKQKGKGAKIMLYIVATGLLLAGLQLPLTMLAGSRTTGVVESVKHDTSSSDKMDYNYDVSYSFVTEKGRPLTGSYRLSRVYNISKLPRAGARLEVRYLPGLAFINLPADVAGLGRSAFVLIGLGALLLVFAIKMKTT